MCSVNHPTLAVILSCERGDFWGGRDQKSEARGQSIRRVGFAGRVFEAMRQSKMGIATERVPPNSGDRSATNDGPFNMHILAYFGWFSNLSACLRLDDRIPLSFP